MNEDIPGVVPGSAVLIKGRPIRDIPMPIREAVEVQNQRVVVMGDVFAMDSREVRGERTILTYQITDGTYSVLVKIFDTTEKLSKMPFGEIKKGSTLLIIGRIGYDDFAREDVLKPESIVMVKRQRKMDNAPKKRVELHCHTNMSQMDAVTPCERLVQRAHEWGHPAIAITDHGIAQAFPDAMNAWRGFKDKDFKVIFGCEAYVVNDLNRLMVIDNPGDRTLQDEIIIFDVETTGLSPTHDRLTEIGAVRMRGMQVVETFNTMVDPERRSRQRSSNSPALQMLWWRVRQKRQRHCESSWNSAAKIRFWLPIMQSLIPHLSAMSASGSISPLTLQHWTR